MKSLKRVVIGVLVVFLFGFVLPTEIQAQEKKIGYLDLSKIFDTYGKTKEYDAVLEEQHKVWQEERNAKIEALKEKEGKLALLKEDEKEKVQKELDEMVTELNAYDQGKRTDLTKQRDERIREILLEIEKAVSDFAKKEKYDLILNDRVLIYGNEALDITDQVLEILDDSYQKK